jgi:hypothetical protein
MPPQNYAKAFEGIRKDTRLEIPDVREISKKLGNEAQLKTFGAFTLVDSRQILFFFWYNLKNHKMFGKMYLAQCRGAQIPGARSPRRTLGAIGPDVSGLAEGTCSKLPFWQLEFYGGC